MIQKGNTTLLQRLPKAYFAADVDRSKCLHVTSSNALFRTHYVGSMIYHKFSYDDVSYRIKGENVKVMLELSNTSFNGIRLRLNRVVPVLLCFSIDITDVERHKRQ